MKREMRSCETIGGLFTNLKLAIQLFQPLLELWISFSHDGGCLAVAAESMKFGGLSSLATESHRLKGPDGRAESRDVV